MSESKSKGYWVGTHRRRDIHGASTRWNRELHGKSPSRVDRIIGNPVQVEAISSLGDITEDGVATAHLNDSGKATCERLVFIVPGS